ncbi:MAG: tRNA pseudouridine(38-40) synthase TruA [Lachnospiraceae bacterium]|nr:tRNA pseudouridine(38-40) synthase TruA [Lachnospiraceae bacterium]
MATYKMTLAYDGSRYSGWQKQGNTENTIQAKIEGVLSRLLEEPVEVAGSGRTDEGVHALAQAASFRTERVPDGDRLTAECNRYLPQDIRVLSTVLTYPRFHARLSATGKWYEYRIDNGPVARIFERKYLTRVEEPLDIAAMREAAAFLLGEHDFASFCDNKHMKKSTVRHLCEIVLEEQEGILTIALHGDGFLYHMLRILCGTLSEGGLGERRPYGMQRILEARDRSAAGRLAPAQGLFLREVEYPV